MVLQLLLPLYFPKKPLQNCCQKVTSIKKGDNERTSFDFPSTLKCKVKEFKAQIDGNTLSTQVCYLIGYVYCSQSPGYTERPTVYSTVIHGYGDAGDGLWTDGLSVKRTGSFLSQDSWSLLGK